jgi:hypothetical protein
VTPTSEKATKAAHRAHPRRRISPWAAIASPAAATKTTGRIAIHATPSNPICRFTTASASQRPSAAAIASQTSRAAVVVVGAGRWAACSPRRVPCPSNGSATSARSAPTSAPIGAPAGTQPAASRSQLARAHATLAPTRAPMAAPAITAATPLQPIGRVSGLGTEGCCTPASMGRGLARHKRHDCSSASSASRSTGLESRNLALGDGEAGCGR